MKRLIFLILVSLPVLLHAQTDTSKWLRAFPITDYMVDINDTTKVVQVEMPDGLSLKEKQPGMLYGVFNKLKEEAVEKGYGRCNLIKGNYYYFTISNNKSGKAIQKGDLIYTFIEKTKIYYGQVPQLASHFIRLLDVYENPLYDRYTVFDKWTEGDDKAVIDSAVADIKFTGNYFKENNPNSDVIIKEGKYKGGSTFDMMMNCAPGLLASFFDYIIARPRNYAGHEWKVSETFATWVSEGAPTVIKE
jgi:hypothetical protein